MGFGLRPAGALGVRGRHRWVRSVAGLPAGYLDARLQRGLAGNACFGCLQYLSESPACLPGFGRYTGTMRFLIMLGMACALAVGAAGQGLPLKKPAGPPPALELQTELFQDRFLPGEPVEVEFRLRNLSGQPLTFRPEDDWLDVTVWSLSKATGEGVPVARLKPVRVEEAFTVAHTKAVKTRVDVAPCFNLMRPGRFKLTATLVLPGVRGPVQAAPLLLEVVPGSKIWEQEFGFRAVDGPAVPELRKYALQKMTTKTSVRLYVGVTDGAEETVFRQVFLGRVANSDQPQRMLDRLSYLHVVHQTGPRTFTHTVVSPAGDVLRRATFDAVDGRSRPMLKPDEEGRVVLVGGVRRPQADDVPAVVAAPAVSPDPPAFP